MQPVPVRDAGTPPPLLDPDEVERAEEDVIPTLWRRGRRQELFLGGLALFATAIAFGIIDWIEGPAPNVAVGIVLLTLASVCWALGRSHHGPIFASVVAGTRRAPGTIRVRWRLADDGRVPGGDGEIRFEGSDLVGVRTERVFWDLIAIAGIAGTTAFVVAGRSGDAFPALRGLAMLLGILALTTFGLPRRRRVESLVPLDDITRIDLRGARYFVTYRGGLEPLIFDAGQLARMRINEQLDRLMRERFHIDAHLRPGQVVTRAEPSLDDLDATAARLGALRNGGRPAR